MKMYDPVEKRERPIKIALDFDGVLHDYAGGFTGPIPFGKPVPGALFNVNRLVKQGYELSIFSTRCDPKLSSTHMVNGVLKGCLFVEMVDFCLDNNEWVTARNRGLTLGEYGIREWLKYWKFEVLKNAKISYKKTHCDLYLDDRGLRFDGDWDMVWEFLERNPKCSTWTGEV